MRLHKNTTLLTALAVIIVLIVTAIWYFSVPPRAGGPSPTDAPSSTPQAEEISSTPSSSVQTLSGLDAFAACLSSKGFAMYGLYSCPHCQAEKALFGDSFRYVNYVECSTETDKCLAENVEAVPTWIGPNGARLVGTQSLAQLSQASGCALPANY